MKVQFMSKKQREELKAQKQQNLASSSTHTVSNTPLLPNIRSSQASSPHHHPDLKPSNDGKMVDETEVRLSEYAMAMEQREEQPERR